MYFRSFKKPNLICSEAIFVLLCAGKSRNYVFSLFWGAIVDARLASEGIPSQLTANWSCLGLVSQTVTYLSNRWRRNVLIGK